MEACGGAHHWAHAITELGHAVRLMSPALVAPYRTGNQHDRNDADAICEAVRRPRMRFVAVKSVAQQDLLALHRGAHATAEAAYRVQQSDACAAA